METSHWVLPERVQKVRKKRRKKSCPDVSPVIETAKNNNPNTKVSIWLQIPANTSTPLPTHLTQSNFHFSPPCSPTYGNGPEYLEMVKRTVQLIAHASRLHYALYEKPTDKQTHQRQHLETARLLLQKVASGQVSKVVEGCGNFTTEDNTENSTVHFVDVSTMTTTSENVSLCDRIHSLEYKLNKLLSKPSYASALQQVSTSCVKLQAQLKHVAKYKRKTQDL